MERIIRKTNTASFQATIGKKVVVKGNAAFIKEKAQVTFLPGKPNTGILFEIGDTLIPATVDYLVKDSRFPNTSILRRNGVQIHTVEHILAGIIGLGISNIRVITLKNGQIPIGDGSSFDFCDALLSAEPKRQIGAPLQNAIFIQKPFVIRVNDSWAKFTPSKNRGLRIKAEIDYARPIGNQKLEYIHSRRSFCLRLAWARTFGFNPFKTRQKTSEKLPGFYLEKGSYINSNMIIYRKNKYITHIRRCDEAIRHKILDFLGDLSLLNAPVSGEISLYKPGHVLNHAVINSIWKYGGE